MALDVAQNLIGDAQYGEALREMDKLKPRAKFTAPPPGWALQEQVKALGIGYATVVAEPLGAYCFGEYLKERAPSSVVLLDFARDILEYKKIKRKQCADADKLWSKYEREVQQYGEDFRETKEAWGEDVFATADKARVFDAIEHKIGQQLRKDYDGFAKCDDSAMPPGVGAAFVKGGPQAQVMGPVPHFLVYAQLVWYNAQRRDILTVKKFAMFRELGRGAFGAVSGAALHTTGLMVALKMSNRKLVKGKNAKKLIKAEKEVLAILGDHPSKFCVYLIYAFADADFFYFALPLKTGGDLNYHLNQAPTHTFTVARARFYAAEIMVGVAHMHSMGIIYRDLKPENILLDEEGHAAISDMGLAVVTNGRRWRGRAGTPGYWAPEMLAKEKYSYASDWWGYGCMVFEFFVGKCPFSASLTKMEDRDEGTLHFDLEENFPRKIKNADGKMPFPEDAKELLLKLLRRDPETRYGAKGVGKIKHHKFFKGMDWRKLNNHEIEPPWKPNKHAINAASQEDLKYRNSEAKYAAEKVLPEDDIDDFDYISKEIHQEHQVRVMTEYRAGKLPSLEAQGGGCCTIS